MIVAIRKLRLPPLFGRFAKFKNALWPTCALSPYGVRVGELMFGNKLRWTNPRPNVLWQHCLCGSSAARWAAIVSSRFYSAGTANGSSGDGLTLSCRGFPIKTG